MTTEARFPAAFRLLHWPMAPMIVAMLFIGVGMAQRILRFTIRPCGTSTSSLDEGVICGFSWP
jgi:hypothetical protein